MNVTVTPADAIMPKLVYSSSDETVATIDQDGNITVLAAGTCVLTATTEDGKLTTSTTITCRDTWTVTVASSNAAVNGSGEYRLGDTVTIDAGDPAENKEFIGWETSSEIALTDSTNASTTFTMIEGDVTITAKWVDYHTVTMNGDCNTVDGGTKFIAGTVVGVSCNDGDLVEWSCSDPTVTFADKDASTTTFVMPDNDVTIDHTFKTYTVTLAGATSGVTGAGHYAPGTEVTIAYSPITGYEWVMDKTNVPAGFTTTAVTNGEKFTMPESDITLTVSRPAAKVPLTIDGGGTIVGGGTSGEVNYGAPISISAPATSGTAKNTPFYGWEVVSGSGTFADPKSRETTFTVTAE